MVVSVLVVNDKNTTAVAKLHVLI